MGLVVARAAHRMLPADVTVLEREGEPTSLIDAWNGADVVWLVDAVSSASAAGSVHRFDASRDPLPAAFGGTSTHHFGLPEAVELARSLRRLPRRLVVYGIEGASFDAGDELSPAVAAVVDAVAASIRDEALAATSPHP